MNTNTRTTAAKQTLIEHQYAMQDAVLRRIRSGRTDRPPAAGDTIDQSEADTQGDLDMALLEMQTETLTRIDAALGRVETGQYGTCVQCGHHISDERLRAMPFAVRCLVCEHHRELGRPLGATRAWGVPLLSAAARS